MDFIQKNKALVVVGVVLLFIVMWGFGSYNTMVTMNENVNGKWGQVENQLQRRGDLIPNLVNTVKGYASHEQAAIQAVADARAKLAGAKAPADKIQANGQLDSALSRLLMVTENYPNLKADKQFKQLMDELSGTENRLAVARKDYNESIQVYNTKIKHMPSSLIAGLGGFTEKPYFKAEEAAKAVPQVKF